MQNDRTGKIFGRGDVQKFPIQPTMAVIVKQATNETRTMTSQNHETPRIITQQCAKPRPVERDVAGLKPGDSRGCQRLCLRHIGDAHIPAQTQPFGDARQ